MAIFIIIIIKCTKHLGPILSQIIQRRILDPMKQQFQLQRNVVGQKVYFHGHDE